MCTLAASSHSSLQYLLPCAGGHPQVSRAHLFSFLSSAISTHLLRNSCQPSASSRQPFHCFKAQQGVASVITIRNLSPKGLVVCIKFQPDARLTSSPGEEGERGKRVKGIRGEQIFSPLLPVSPFPLMVLWCRADDDPHALPADGNLHRVSRLQW